MESQLANLHLDGGAAADLKQGSRPSHAQAPNGGKLVHATNSSLRRWLLRAPSPPIWHEHGVNMQHFNRINPNSVAQGMKSAVQGQPINGARPSTQAANHGHSSVRADHLALRRTQRRRAFLPSSDDRRLASYQVDHELCIRHLLHWFRRLGQIRRRPGARRGTRSTRDHAIRPPHPLLSGHRQDTSTYPCLVAERL